jgi:glycosyltransferase involved in cell wall biosynthesis
MKDQATITQNDLAISNGVNLIGMFCSESGVGQAARSVYRSIKTSQIPFSLINYYDEESKSIETIDSSFAESAPHKVNLFNFNADTSLEYFTRINCKLLIDHYNIGYFNWELETFPDQFLDSFFFYDEIWTPSVFTQKAIQAKSPIPVFCIPYSVNISTPSNHLNRDHFGLENGSLIYLYVFDCRSIFLRKNPCAVVQAFKQAFDNQDDVQLVIKMINGSKYQKEVKKLKRLAKGSKNIVFIDALFNREQAYALMNACDVFVSLHRSEGYGLNLCEAMALGKPVIATNYSANIDYMDESNGYLVKYQKIQIKKNLGPYPRGEIWAEPCIEHAAHLMRHIYQNREEAKQKGLNAMRTMQTHYSEEAIGCRIRERLQAIYEQKTQNSTIESRFLTNPMDFSIKSTRPFVGPIITCMRKALLFFLKPVLLKQARINNWHTIQLASVLKKLESLEEEIKNLRDC